MWEYTAGCNIHRDGRHWASVSSGVGLYVTVATWTRGFNSLYLGFNHRFLVIYQLTFKTEVKTFILRKLSDTLHTLKRTVWGLKLRFFLTGIKFCRRREKNGLRLFGGKHFHQQNLRGGFNSGAKRRFQPQISSVRKKISAQSFSSRSQKHTSQHHVCRRAFQLSS